MAIISESREVAEFDRILVKGIGKFLIKQGGEQSVTVKADEEIIKRITTEVIDRKLVIDIGRDWVERISVGFNLLSSREIVVEISARELFGLEIAGACDLEASGIRGDSLEIKMSGASSVKVFDVDTNKIMTDMPGAGKILVNGKTGEQQITMTGAGAYDASHLESQNARVTLTGVGSATIWAKENLEVSVTGVGSIEYYGNPHIKQSTTMLGSIRNLGEVPK